MLVTITCAWDVAVGTEDADDGGGAAGAASGLLVLDRTKFLAVNKVFITMYMLQIAPTNAKACNKTKYLLPMSMQLADRHVQSNCTASVCANRRDPRCQGQCHNAAACATLRYLRDNLGQR